MENTCRLTNERASGKECERGTGESKGRAQLKLKGPLLPFSANRVGVEEGIRGVSVPVLALRSPCAALPTDPAMAGPPRGKRVFKVILTVLVALILLHSASSQSHADFVPPGQQKREAPVDLLSQIGRSVRGTLEAWLGPETIHLVSEVRKVLPAVTTPTEERQRRRRSWPPRLGSTSSLCHNPCCREPHIVQDAAREFPLFRNPIVRFLP